MAADARSSPKDDGNIIAPIPIWVLLLSLILALFIVGRIAAAAPDFDKVALGDQTTAVYGSYQGGKIFCGQIDEVPQCLGPARERNLKTRIVWLGNSQLHAINQLKSGDRTAPVLLAEQLRPKGVEVQAFSLPNSSLSEMLMIWSVYSSDHHINTLVVPLFLDDMREQQVRPLLRAALNNPQVAADLNSSATARQIVARLPDPIEEEQPTSRQSMQEHSEEAITNVLQRCCGFQTMREKARGQIDIMAVLLRNWAFGITAQTVRPVLPEAYQQNRAALEDMLKRAQAVGTRVILYIPPLRQDYAPPYDMAEYRRFKTDTRTLAGRYGAQWIDADNIVPGRYWGTKASTTLGGKPELDFMHFQEPGHVALAKRIEAALAGGGK